MKPSLIALAAALGTLPLGGCLVGTVVEVAAETVEAGVEITGAAVGAVVDVVDGDDDDDEDDD